MKPDKVSAVLKDYRSGKASSASELAKLHGVSRSAVYRLLKAETGKAPTDTSTSQQVPATPQRPEKVANEDTETGESLIDTLL